MLSKKILTGKTGLGPLGEPGGSALELDCWPNVQPITMPADRETGGIRDPTPVSRGPRGRMLTKSIRVRLDLINKSLVLVSVSVGFGFTWFGLVAGICSVQVCSV